MLDRLPDGFAREVGAARCVVEIQHDGRRVRVTYRPAVLLEAAFNPLTGEWISQAMAVEVLGRAVVSISLSAQTLAAEPDLAEAVAVAVLDHARRWLFDAASRYERHRTGRRR